MRARAPQGVLVASRSALLEREGALDVIRDMIERLDAHLRAEGQFTVCARLSLALSLSPSLSLALSLSHTHTHTRTHTHTNLRGVLRRSETLSLLLAPLSYSLLRGAFSHVLLRGLPTRAAAVRR